MLGIINTSTTHQGRYYMINFNQVATYVFYGTNALVCASLVLVIIGKLAY